MLGFSYRIALFASTTGIALVLHGAASAQAPTVSPLQQITRGSIFNKCTADNVAQQEATLGSTQYPNTEIEPYLAINPVNPSIMLVGMQQDRWSDGGSRGQRGQYTTDGGATWRPSSTTGVTKCQTGPWQRSSDPWVDYSADGAVAYFSALTFNTSPNTQVFGSASGMTVNMSTDGGATWSQPATLILDTNPNVLNDKNAVTADATNRKVAYVVWDRLQQFVAGAGVADEGGRNGGQEQAAKAAAVAAVFPKGLPRDAHAIAEALATYGRKMRAGQAAPVGPLLVRGPSYLSRTTDQGKTWSQPRIIWNPGDNSQTIGNQVVNLYGGQIADFFVELQDNTAGQPARIGAVFSSDKGVTWTRANYAQSVVNVGAVLPNLQDDIRSADVIEEVAADTANGLVYLVWEDSRFSGVNEVVFALSPDNGFSWTAPVRIAQTPRKPKNTAFQQSLIPQVAVLADGTVGVTYYDFRNDKPGAAGDLADYWLVTCNPFVAANACTETDEWTNEVRMTDTSFNYALAPVASGHFLGDYMGLKAVGQTFYAVFGQSRQQDQTNLYFRTVTLPATPVAARKLTVATSNQ